MSSKLKTFCAFKFPIKKVRGEKNTIEKEKIFANHISDKDLIHRIYILKKILHCNKLTQFKNRQRICRHISEEVIQMGVRHRKNGPISLVVREKQLKPQ